MEERVRANGSGNGSHTGTGGREVGGGKGTGESVGAVNYWVEDAKARQVAEVSCAEHGMRLADCFHLHHGVGAIGIVPEPLQIVLPCRHLCNRPTKSAVVVECECGRRWRLTLECAGKAWDAQEVVI